MTVPELFPGRIVGGKYTLHALLKRAPWASTHRAITSPNREVVVKIFDTALAARPDVLIAIQRAEMAGAALPAHMSLPVVEQGVDAELGVPYIVTPCAATPSLAQLVELCPLSPRETVGFTQNLARALDAAHFAGYHHLALKPSNIFVGPSPIYNVQVCDFGANATRALTDEAERLSFSAPWLAPEQAQGDGAAGPEADVFAVALIAFFALTGRSLWPSCRGASPDLAAWRSEIERAPPRVSQAADEVGCVLDPAFDDVFARALGPVADRPKSVGVFAEELAVSLGSSSLAPAPLESNIVATAISLPPDAIEPAPSDRPLRIPTLAPPMGTSMPPVPTFLDPATPGVGAVQAVPAPNPVSRPQTVPYWNELAAQSGNVDVEPAPAPASSATALPAQGQPPSVVIAAPYTYGTSPRAPLPTLASKRVLRRPWIAAGVGVALGAAFGLVAFSRSRIASFYGSAAATATPSSAVAAPPPAASAPGLVGAPPAPAASAGPAPVGVAAAPPVAPPPPVAPEAPASTGAIPLSGTSRPDDAELTVVCEPTCDIVAVDSRPFPGYPRPVAIRPGTHGIGASRAHYGGQWKQVVVRPGEKTSIVFKLNPLEGGPKKPCGLFLKRCKE